MPILCQSLAQADTDFRHSWPNGFALSVRIAAAFPPIPKTPVPETHAAGFRFERDRMP